MNIPENIKSLTNEQLVQLVYELVKAYNELLHKNNELSARVEALEAELARRKKSLPNLK